MNVNNIHVGQKIEIHDPNHKCSAVTGVIESIKTNSVTIKSESGIKKIVPMYRIRTWNVKVH